MKKITFLCFLLLTSLGFSQTILEDFEGTAPTVNLLDGFQSANVVADPVTSSEKSLELITSASASAWQGAELLFQGDNLDLSQTNKVVTARVYSLTATDILAKVTVGAGPDSATDAAHTGSGWETLSFNFAVGKDNTGPANGVYGNIIFYPLWNSLGATCINGCYSPFGTPGVSAMTTIYIDDISGIAVPPPPTCTDGIQNQGETGVDCGGPCSPCPVPPSVAAPTPPARNAQDVISIYSDAYTDIVVDEFDFGLCTGDVPNVATTEVMIAGNATQYYTSGTCQGIDFQSNRQDASEFTRVHFDFYTDQTDLIGKVFNIKLVDWAGNPTEAGSTGLEVNVNDGNGIVTGSWVSVDVDITAIMAPQVVGNLTRSDVAQFHITSNLTSVWYDNVYLYRPLANDECADAIPVVVGSDPIEIGNLAATDSGQDSCFNGPVADVWYSFVAPISEEVSITVGGTSQYALFSDCTTEVSCNTSINPNLTAGQTYYIAVTDEGSSVTRVPGASTLAVAETATFSNDDFNANSFKVHPNPTTNVWEVEGNSVIDTIEVYDILGKRVMTLSPNNQNATIDGSALTTGLYLAKLRSGNGTKTIRLLKN